MQNEKIWIPRRKGKVGLARRVRSMKLAVSLVTHHTGWTAESKNSSSTESFDTFLCSGSIDRELECLKRQDINLTSQRGLKPSSQDYNSVSFVFVWT